MRAKFIRVVLSPLGTDAGPQGRHLASLATRHANAAATLARSVATTALPE